MVDEFPQAQVPGEGGRQEQAGIGHQAAVVEGDADTVGIVLWQRLLDAPCILTLARDNSSYVAVRSAADR